MGLRTVAQYVESLRDGRSVYLQGEKIDDVTTHPNTQITVQHCSNVFSLPENPEYRDLFVAEAGGEPISRYYDFPKDAAGLRRRNQLIETHTGLARGQLNLIKAIGADAMMALTHASHVMSLDGGSEYAERVAAYVDSVRREDHAVVCAMTDVKGDRSLRPHEQADPDMYVRIVERKSDGIVVRGAKAHTTSSLTANHMLVLPTRAMSEKDEAYAVAFAVPVNAPGVKLICRPMPSIAVSEFDSPISRNNVEGESLTVFDDVFIPWEHVFMCGEWRYAGLLAVTFANFHRFTGVSYRPAIGDLLVGAAQLAADFNGVGKAPHIRDKIVHLIQYTEKIRACAIAAAETHGMLDPGIAMPNLVYTNVGKHHFANEFHEAADQVAETTRNTRRWRRSSSGT